MSNWTPQEGTPSRGALRRPHERDGCRASPMPLGGRRRRRGKCRHSALTHDAEAGYQHTDAAGPLPACLDAVAGALRPSRARGAGPPRRGRRSRCPPAPTLTTVARIASGEDGAVPEADVPTGDVVSEPAASPGVYRLRAVLHAVSPLIWRRLLGAGESTVADLHTIVQTAFGWGGEHLHRFVIHGAEYGINYVGGPGFRDARQVRLGGLGLRVGERFFYEYNFFAGWRVDLRVEEIVAAEPGRVYPRCTAGREPAHPRAGTDRGRSSTPPSRTWCSPRRYAPPRSWASCWTPIPTPSRPPWVWIATSSPRCCRFVGWSVSTSEGSTGPWPTSPPQRRRSRHEGHRSGCCARQRRVRHPDGAPRGAGTG